MQAPALARPGRLLRSAAGFGPIRVPWKDGWARRQCTFTPGALIELIVLELPGIDNVAYSASHTDEQGKKP
jgi:hypothetical protein